MRLGKVVRPSLFPREKILGKPDRRFRDEAHELTMIKYAESRKWSASWPTFPGDGLGVRHRATQGDGPGSASEGRGEPSNDATGVG